MARIPGLTVEAKAVDLVPELDRVGGVDVARPQIPQVDPAREKCWYRENIQLKQKLLMCRNFLFYFLNH
jgi:hypothetical protein